MIDAIKRWALSGQAETPGGRTMKLHLLEWRVQLRA
jgi:hypothetical protein